MHKTVTLINGIILNTQTNIQGLGFRGILTQKSKIHMIKKTAFSTVPSRVRDILRRVGGKIIIATGDG